MHDVRQWELLKQGCVPPKKLEPPSKRPRDSGVADILSKFEPQDFARAIKDRKTLLQTSKMRVEELREAFKRYTPFRFRSHPRHLLTNESAGFKKNLTAPSQT